MTMLSSRGSESFESRRDWHVPTPTTSVDQQQSSYELQPINSSDNDRDIKASWHSLFAFTTRQHAASLVFAGLATIGAGILKPISAIFFGNIFSALTKFGAGTLNGQETLEQISIWCIALVALGGGTWFFEGALLSTWMVFGELQAKSVREQMFTGMLKKDMEWYDLREDGIGSLLIRIQTQIRELQLAVSQPLGFLLLEIVGSLAALGTALYFSWKLTLVVIATFPVAAIVLYIMSMRLGPAIEAQKRELSRASKYANTAITAIDTVKTFNGQDHEVWQYYSTIKQAAGDYLVQARANALQFGVTKFMMVAIFVQGFWYGISLANKGLDPGNVVTTFYACLSAMQAVEIVLPQWLVLTKGMSAGETLKSIRVQLKPGRKGTIMDGSVKPTSCPGDIEVNRVSFAYPSNPRQSALSNTNFFFPSGETTFVVGKSGSGKSTLGNLIMKYYEPLWGEMLIDGQSIQTLSSEWLRENITLVQQQSVVFNETLRHNIALGTRNPFTEEDIKAACKIAGLKQLISELPEGLNTIVGSNGRALSGGQQQRVAIARARLRDAPVLILDEATSALDQTSRMEVVAAIREWRQGRTTIIITHDISQILDDDYVYVLESGMVVQEGYCRVLAEKAHGTFSTFRSASQMVDGKPAEPRRNSEPASPTYTESSIDENEFPQRWGYISKIFGMHEAISNDVSKSMSIQGNNRMSLGVASIQANSLRADNIWSSPVISEPEFFSPHIMRTPLIPFMSPRSPPPKPSPDLRPLPLRREGLALIMAATNMSESVTTAGHPRSKPPPIDTTMSHPGALITKAQLTARLKREREPTRRRKIKPASLTKIFGTIWPTLTRMDRLILLFGFLAALVLAAATPAFAIVFAELLNVFYAKENQAAQARKWALSLLAIAVIDGVAAFCTHYALEYSGQAWVNSLRVEAMKRILNQPKSWFDSEKNSPSRLNECLDRNAEEMRNLIGRFAGLVFTAFWMLAISIVWSFTISWKLTLVALACAPVMYAITRTFHFTSNKWEDKCNKSSDATGSIFTETFSNIRVVRAFTLESHFNHKHDKVAADTYKIGLCRAAYAGLLFGLTDSVSFFITALIFYYGAKIISSGEGSVGSIIEVMNLLLFGIANATNLLSMVPQISSSRTTATQMLYLASLPQRDSHEAQGVTRIPTPFPIQFTNLSFTYPSKSLHTKALSDINLTITAGTCTAIVGPSGSGKSTLASILLGLYPPDPSTPEGSPAPLTFSGMSISNLNIHTLRHHLSIVPQTPLLFPSSILNNIAYGLSERSQYNNLASAIAAAKDAGIHDFIMSLENGYSTPIGDGGMGLSGGQAQRIAIARALVRCPKVLVLDEATSALDGVSAEGIRETIRRVTKRRGSSSSLGSEGDGERRGMAVVIISHNVEMMRVADVIVVIEDGRVVEKGAFEELKRKGGPFARLIGAGRESGANVMVVERLMTPVKARSRNSWIRETIV